jgi:RNA-binding protein
MIQNNLKPSELKHEAAHLVPSLNIGKGGITEPLIKELLRQLRHNKLVKVKILRTAIGNKDRNLLAKELSGSTKSRLIEVKGNCAVFYLK